MDNKRPLVAHMSMFLACVFWGLMAPVGKDAMAHGISGIELVLFRVAGAAVLFWLASMFTGASTCQAATSPGCSLQACWALCSTSAATS